VVNHVIRDKLLVIEALRTINKSCLNAITRKVESLIYSPEDIIVLEGGAVTGAHIIAKGTVLRSHSGGSGEPLELHEGQLFGENGLVESYASHHTYTAKEYSEILYLPGPTFRHLCQLYLTAAEIDVLIASLAQLARDSYAARRTVNTKDRTTLFGATTSLAAFVRSPSERQRSVRAKETKLAALYRLCMTPNSKFRLWWGALTFCGVVFYTLTCGLLLQATLRQRFVAHYGAMLAACYAVDAIFIVDTVMQAFCFAYDDNGVIVTDWATIFDRYRAQPSALTMLVVVTPFDLIFGLSLSYRLIPVLRLLKLAHLSRFDGSYSSLEDLLFAYAGVAVSFELNRFVYLYLLLFFVCHWCGCLWTLLAEVSMKVFGYDTSWRYVDSHDGFFALDYTGLSGSVPYWRAMDWTVIVMSGVGWGRMFPTNPIEVVGMTVLMFIGHMLFTMLMGAVSSLMGSFNSTEHTFNLKVDKVRELLKYKSVCKPIEHKTVMYGTLRHTSVTGFHVRCLAV
jgi:CRP-like cAMP-binding protein